MNMTEKLLADIRDFLRVTGMAPSRFGAESCGNRHLVLRLKAGASVGVPRYEEIRAYMDANEAYRLYVRKRKAGKSRRRPKKTHSASAAA